MKAIRLSYNARANELDETPFTFSVIRVENFEVLKWATVYEDELEIIEAQKLYDELFEEDTEIKLLLHMKNGQEVIINFDREIYNKLNEYIN